MFKSPRRLDIILDGITVISFLLVIFGFIYLTFVSAGHEIVRREAFTDNPTADDPTAAGQ